MDNKATHTPGPWVVHQIPSMPETVGHYVVTEDGLTVCRTEYQLPERVGTVVVEAKRRANARLIAAAPEMLDALQMAKHIVANEGTDAQMDQVFAAIARATGQEGGAQ